MRQTTHVPTPPRAVILTAGRSAALGPATADRPVSLVEVGGDTLIRRQKDALRRAGVWRIAAVAGWRTDGFHGTDLTLFENPLWADTTSLDSLAVADDWLRRAPVVVHFGNVVVSPETIRRLCAAPGPLAVVYAPLPRPGRTADPVRLDLGGRYVTWMGHTAHPGRGRWLRLVKTTPAAWAVLRHLREAGRDRRPGVGEALAELVRQRLMPVTAVRSAGPWHPFDTPTDLVAGAAVVDRLDRARAR
ncbi:NTP transferase domain-containing protein [Actinosynnema sp. NPDC059335]|uniref:NTP transferase domain-containing protein n=1 Tax=Actinosynnema sp. NPDC059335 TaxID=3346804 RepID=UPI00366FBE33